MSEGAPRRLNPGIGLLAAGILAGFLGGPALGQDEAAGEESWDEAVEASSLTPFYEFELVESFSIPSLGNFFFGSNIGTTLGARYVLSPEHSLFGVYNLAYVGPGLRSEESREFADRTMDHQAGLGHQWQINPKYQLNTRFSYLGEFRRSGSNEPFGAGLYDFASIGVSETVRMVATPRVLVGLTLAYARVSFPNYTDLLTEFQLAGTSAEVSGGLQDYNRLTISPDVTFGRDGRAWLSWTRQDFTNAKVLTDAVSAQGTYSNETQLDAVYEVGASWAFSLFAPSAGVSTEPMWRLNIKRSNQNFFRFDEFGDISPDFIKDNYSYVSTDLTLPVRRTLESGRMFFFYPTWLYRSYSSRPPRSSAGDYVFGEKQWNQTWLLTLGTSWPAYKFARWTFAYTYHHQRSNNHFERFLPYNFSGHVLSSSLSLTY